MLQENPLNRSRFPVRREQVQPGPVAPASNGQIADLQEQIAGLGTGALRLNWRSVSANTAVNSTDYLILVDATAGNVTVTLPAVAPGGRQVCVKRVDGSGNTVTVARAGAATIDGATSRAITPQYAALTVMSDATNWWVV